MLRLALDETRLRRLRDDEGGAILVSGIVMTMLLAGVLCHMESVGAAILYREYMQDAADSTAFGSAVWHARTMNLLVTLNLIMAAVLAVLVFWRMVELLLGLATIVTGILGLIPFMEWLLPVSENLADITGRMLSKDQKIYDKVDSLLLKFNKAEKVISTYAPALDLAAPALENSAYFAHWGQGKGQSADQLNVAFPVSFSIIPSGESFMPESASFPTRMNLSPYAPALPVQEESFFRLCGKAGGFLANQGSGLATRFHSKDVATGFSKLGKAFEAVIGSFPEYFCNGMGNSDMPEAASQAINDAAKSHCDSDKAKAGDNFDMKACLDSAKKDLALKKDAPSHKSWKVWDVARDGSLFFQVWGFANGSPVNALAGDRSIARAPGNGKSAGALEGDAQFEWSIAEAEYYYDGTGSWADCASDAAWNLRWTARLRRVRDPVSQLDLAAVASGWSREYMNKWIGDRISGAFKNNPKLQSVPTVWQKSAWNTWLSDHFFKGPLRYPLDSVAYDQAHMDSWGGWIMHKVNGGQRNTLIH